MTRKSKKRSKKHTECLKALILLPWMDLPSSLPGKPGSRRKRRIAKMRSEVEAINMKLVKREKTEDDSEDSDSEENGDSEE